MRTTYGGLLDALDPGPVELAVGGVSYLDDVAGLVDRYRTVNTYNLAFCKRTEFKAEQEVRVVHQDFGEGPFDDHVRMPLGLGLLGETIVVLGPNSAPDRTAQVAGALAAAGVAWPTVSSAFG